VLVILEEVGLAEISPHNPLKVLHELLEPPQVAVVGISNWQLDASKMNRGISLLRPDPTKDDLRESALKIAQNINQHHPERQRIFEHQYLQWLTYSYLLTLQ
jgi:E3 ubiquitin-protein ligase RNF213